MPVCRSHVGTDSSKIIMASLNVDNCVAIPDDFDGFNPNAFCIPSHLAGSVRSVLIPHGMIKDRIQRMADDIFQDLTNDSVGSVSMLCVLKGAYRFFSDLKESMCALNNSGSTPGSLHMFPEFIRLKSYENTSTTGEVQIVGMENLERIKGQVVVIVEDIIDTGRTMQKLLATLAQFEPKRILVACLLRKRTPLSDGFCPDYIGFEIPDKFVIGYALDYNEYFRDLMPICVINEEGIEKFKK
eukprot:snap_masked-scaffold764_size101305-processed-gene-0.5 protein:Tk04089 transcript:snap_masked-scaffold764_size101305-processed-gene-0.5-mRNA-1 annotation:"hypoxanthine-guanine phosphoribosyltransferase"